MYYSHFSLSLYISHLTVSFLSILLVWNALLFSVTSLLSFHLSQRAREQKMTKRNDLKEAGSPATSPLNKHMPRGVVRCETSVYCSFSNSCHSRDWSVHPRGTESTRISQHWEHVSYNMVPNTSQLFAQGPFKKQQFVSTLEKNLRWNVVSSVAPSSGVQKSNFDYMWVSCYADSACVTRR